MGNADIGYLVLQIGFAVIVVAQIDLLVEQLVQQGPDRQPLLAQGLAFDERDFFHLVRGRRTHFLELLFRFRNLPDRNGGLGIF